MKLFVIYLICMMILGWLSMGLDKKKAINKSWRVPEKILFLIAVLGGAFGSWTGMYSFRHKTKHWYFVIGMPALTVIWGVVIFLVFKNV